MIGKREKARCSGYAARESVSVSNQNTEQADFNRNTNYRADLNYPEKENKI